MHFSICIYIIFAPSFIHFSLATTERIAFSYCNQGPVTSQAETPRKWLYWDQKIESHDDWIMNYHSVQLQPRLLEALIGCLQFFPERMKCLSPWTSQPSLHHRFTTQEHGTLNLVISCRRSRNAASIRFPLLIKTPRSVYRAIVSINAAKDSDYACHRPLFNEG